MAVKFIVRHIYEAAGSEVLQASVHRISKRVEIGLFRLGKFTLAWKAGIMVGLVGHVQIVYDDHRTTVSAEVNLQSANVGGCFRYIVAGPGRVQNGSD